MVGKKQMPSYDWVESYININVVFVFPQFSDNIVQLIFKKVSLEYKINIWIYLSYFIL